MSETDTDSDYLPLQTPDKQPDQDNKLKQRANAIFKNIFQEIFLSNCSNPIDFEQMKEAFQKHMGGSLTEAQMDDLEQLFFQADLTNVCKPFSAQIGLDTYYKRPSYLRRLFKYFHLVYV